MKPLRVLDETHRWFYGLPAIDLSDCALRVRAFREKGGRPKCPPWMPYVGAIVGMDMTRFSPTLFSSPTPNLALLDDAEACQIAFLMIYFGDLIRVMPHALRSPVDLINANMEIVIDGAGEIVESSKYKNSGWFYDAIGRWLELALDCFYLIAIGECELVDVGFDGLSRREKRVRKHGVYPATYKLLREVRHV